MLLLAEVREEGISTLTQARHERKSPSPAVPARWALGSEHPCGALVMSCRGIIPEEQLPPAECSRLEFASPFFGDRLLAHPGNEALQRQRSALQALNG